MIDKTWKLQRYDRKDYTELVEYVRVGVMLLREELELASHSHVAPQLH